MENYLYTLEICVSPNSLETLKVHMEITFLQELENILSLGKLHFLGWKFVFLAHTNLARQGESLAERRQKIRAGMARRLRGRTYKTEYIFYFPRFIFCKCDHSIFVLEDTNKKQIQNFFIIRRWLWRVMMFCLNGFPAIKLVNEKVFTAYKYV